MNRYNVCILWKGIYSIFYRLLPSSSTRDDLGDLFEFMLFDDFSQAVIHILLADYQEDGTDQGTGLKFLEGMDEDGFSFEEVELFLLPLREAMSFPSGDDHCISIHRSNASHME